ncbi:unnamed protein product [Sphagnum jensenii]|uniref:Uncharacterized protein n=1 Tax=Sphagnum jensenii TaxID=128206 RepID=A0ABP1ANU2_9BRYO
MGTAGVSAQEASQHVKCNVLFTSSSRRNGWLAALHRRGRQQQRLRTRLQSAARADVLPPPFITHTNLGHRLSKFKASK